jgi:hypothetical protein
MLVAMQDDIDVTLGERLKHRARIEHDGGLEHVFQ